MNTTTSTLSPEQEAAQIAALMPRTFYRGVPYPVTYQGNDIKIALTRGVGRNTGRWYLHVYKPCTIILKSSTGEELSRRHGTAHYIIERHNARATWKEVS